MHAICYVGLEVVFVLSNKRKFSESSSNDVQGKLTISDHRSVSSLALRSFFHVMQFLIRLLLDIKSTSLCQFSLDLNLARTLAYTLKDCSFWAFLRRRSLRASGAAASAALHVDYKQIFIATLLTAMRYAIPKNYTDLGKNART